MIGITIDSIEVFTLNPDGSEYKPLDSSTFLKKNRIGEYKKIRVNYVSSESIADTVIYFVPALFLKSGTVPPFTDAPTGSYYSYLIDSVPTVDTYEMNLNASVGYVPDLIKNNLCELIIDSATEFSIELSFYQLYDLLSFLTPSYEDNRWKLLNDRWNNGSTLSVVGDSIYTSDKFRPHFYLFIQKTADLANKFSITTSVEGYQGGFYNKNELQAAPYFTQQEFIIEDPLGNTITKISSTFDTKVRFRCVAPDTVTEVFVWLIKVTGRGGVTDPTVDMKTFYEASTENILTVGGSTTIDNKIKSPSTAPALITGKYEISFHIDKSLVLPGELYRVIAIPHYNMEVYEVNSFISNMLEVDLPTFNGNGYEFTGTLTDYNKEFTGNDLVCVVEERIKSKLVVDYSGDVFKDDILARLGLVVPNDIYTYLQNIKCEIYEDIGTTRHYYKRSQASFSLFLLAWAIPSDMSFTNVGGILTINWDWRNRYESWIPNIESQISGFILMSPTSNQNWAGRTLKVKYSLQLNYYDYAVPFSDNLVFIQTIRPKGYTSDVEIFKEDGEEIGNAEFFCSDESECLKAKFNLPNPEDYNLITTVEKSPGTITSIEENEEYLGELAQLDSDKFASQEVSYSETEATFGKFCLDNSKFVLNLPYKISAIAKKKPNVIPEDGRITEDDIVREVEETTDIRLIE